MKKEYWHITTSLEIKRTSPKPKSRKVKISTRDYEKTDHIGDCGVKFEFDKVDEKNKTYHLTLVNEMYDDTSNVSDNDLFGYELLLLMHLNDEIDELVMNGASWDVIPKLAFENMSRKTINGEYDDDINAKE